MNTLEGMIPKHWFVEFDNEVEWRKAAAARGAIVLDAECECGHPDGTLLAAVDEGTIGIFLPDGHGTMIKRNAGFH